MTRFKWYRIGLPCSYPQLLSRLKARRFTADSAWGFVPLSDPGEPSSHRFVWRSTVATFSLDSQGNSTRQVVDTVDSLVCRFFSAGETVWLRIDDPPRSPRDFLNALEAVSGFGFSAEPQSFSAKQQSQLLQRCDESRMVGLKLVGSSAEHRLVARIEIASKEGILPDQLGFLEELQYTVDHASYEVVQDRVKGQVTFTTSGAVRVSGALLPFIVAQLEALLGGRRR